MSQTRGGLMKYRGLFTLSSLVLLTACGGGGGSSTTSSISSGQGSLNVNLTDAPVDEAANVFVTLRGISLNREEGGWVDHDFETPQRIDLLTLQDGTTFDLFSDNDIEAGTYEVRLNLYSDDDNQLDNYIVISEGGAEHELTIPSGFQTGLKLTQTIEVSANGTADYTIDFDVRQSIVLRGNPQNNNGYLLKPTLRLVNNAASGTISGVITDTTLLTTDCSDQDPLTHNVIYVFEGANVTPDDYDGEEPEAITTANVELDDDSGEYRYTTSPLPDGEYTISLTCNSDLEDTEADEDLLFKATENRTVGTVAEENEEDPEQNEAP